LENPPASENPQISENPEGGSDSETLRSADDERETGSESEEPEKRKKGEKVETILEFGKSRVTQTEIDLLSSSGYFPAGHGRAPSDEVLPEPREGEAVVFVD
jgi:hypothetical protein